jgi:AhpD family alkylhydroperoxidase
VHGGSFTEAQVQTVLLTDAVTNACSWAVAFHTALALKEEVKPADVQAIREGRSPKDAKLSALSSLAKTMIEKRGLLDDRDVDAFIAAGFGKDHVLEVIGIVAASTITNYTGSITRPPSRRRFRPTPGRTMNDALGRLG